MKRSHRRSILPAAIATAFALVLTVCAGAPGAAHAEPAAAAVLPAATTALPDPYKTTPFGAERHDYRVSIDGVQRDVIAYLPVSQNPMLVPLDRPLVVLLHANGLSYAPNAYRGMMEFLAKNGFAVIAPAWDTNAYANVDSSGDQADTIYGSPARSVSDAVADAYRRFGERVSDQLVLVGHSVGGAGVVRSAVTLAGRRIEGRDIRIASVVSMAPAPKARDMREWQTLADKAGSFLMMLGAKDQDVHGLGDPGTIRDTGFKLYDAAGSEAALPANQVHRYPDKHLVFIRGAAHAAFAGMDPTPDSQANGHRRFVSAYVNAFLRRSVYGEKVYDTYLVDGVRPASTPGSVDYRRAHSPAKKLILENFQRGAATSRDFYGGGSGTIGRVLTSSGTIALRRDESKNLTESPHATRVLVATWNSTGTPYIEFDYDDGNRVDVEGYKYLSFRVGQVHEHQHNPVQEDKDLRLRLLTIRDGARTLSASVTARVPYPYREWIVPQEAGQAEVTKSAMHTVTIPLGDFGSGANLKSLDGIRIYLPGKGQVQIDNIEFHGERTVVPVI